MHRVLEKGQTECKPPRHDDHLCTRQHEEEEQEAPDDWEPIDAPNSVDTFEDKNDSSITSQRQHDPKEVDALLVDSAAQFISSNFVPSPLGHDEEEHAPSSLPPRAPAQCHEEHAPHRPDTSTQQLLAHLSEQDREVFQHTIQRILKAEDGGNNFIVTGGVGSGKSILVNAVLKEAELKNVARVELIQVSQLNSQERITECLRKLRSRRDQDHDALSTEQGASLRTIWIFDGYDEASSLVPALTFQKLDEMISIACSTVNPERGDSIVVTVRSGNDDQVTLHEPPNGAAARLFLPSPCTTLLMCQASVADVSSVIPPRVIPLLSPSMLNICRSKLVLGALRKIHEETQLQAQHALDQQVQLLHNILVKAAHVLLEHEFTKTISVNDSSKCNNIHDAAKNLFQELATNLVRDLEEVEKEMGIANPDEKQKNNEKKADVTSIHNFPPHLRRKLISMPSPWCASQPQHRGFQEDEPPRCANTNAVAERVFGQRPNLFRFVAAQQGQQQNKDAPERNWMQVMCREKAAKRLVGSNE